jgi:hypothetical protein
MRRAMLQVGLVAIACGILQACQARTSSEPVVLAVPGALNRMPSLAVAGDRVVAVWTATHNDVMDVYAAVSRDSGATFSEPRRVNDQPGDVSSNAEQPPRVAVSDAAITVIWPSRRDGSSAIRLARSADSGRTFSSAVTIHDPALKGARGWEGIALGRDGAVHATWLDGRHAEPVPAGKAAAHRTGAHAGHGGRGAHEGAPRQDVYHAVILPDGHRTEAHVSRDVCFCCKTAVGVGPGGRVNVAWRHIFPGSMRDIAMATSSDGGQSFGPLVRVSEDNWQLSGCPDDGPAMAIDRDDVTHLVWPSIVNHETPQKAIFYTSTRDGRSFSPRVRLSGDEREDAAHPQIAADSAGNLAVAWDEQQGDTRRIVGRTWFRGAATFGAPQALNEHGSAFHPFVAGLQNGFLIAWPHADPKDSFIRIQRVGTR